MKITEAAVVWGPRDSVRVELLGTEWEFRPGDRWNKATSLGAHGEVPTTGKHDRQLLAMFILFNTIVVRDGVDPAAVHRAFLEIDEYRRAISPDTSGAED